MLHLIPRWLKEPLYAATRCLVGARLRWLPLSLIQAEWWGRTIKSWPAVFQGESFPCETQLTDGLRIPTGVVDHIERHLRIEGVWDRPVSAVLESTLKSGQTFLDIGANIGYFSLRASKLVGPTGQVVSIEPSLRALRKFTENIHRNRCGNVLLLSVGAGVEAARLRLTLANENNIGGSAILQPTVNQGPTESIGVVTLGPLLKSLGIVPDVVKIDVEGFELHALRGLFGDLTARPTIVCEVTAEFLHRNGQQVGELLGFVSQLGYRVFRLIDGTRGVTVEPLSPTGDYEQVPQFDALFVHESQPVPLPISSTVGAVQ